MLILAALWGFAEATLFFIVPDVIVSLVTLRSGPSAGLKASLAAALAAGLGGAGMILWGALDAAGARAALAGLPGIDAAMIDTVATDFAAGGYPAMLAGAFTGVPYKIYAVAAGEAGRSSALFLAMTLPMRLPRFVLTVLLVAAADHLVPRSMPARARLALLAAFWTVFYAWYFSVMP